MVLFLTFEKSASYRHLPSSRSKPVLHQQNNSIIIIMVKPEMPMETADQPKSKGVKKQPKVRDEGNLARPQCFMPGFCRIFSSVFLTTNLPVCFTSFDL
jgi:hypothetical protein